MSHRKELIYSDFQSPFIIPPVQIRTCAANASGSCFESDAQTLPFGAPCLNRSLILPASEFRTQEGKQNSSQPSPFAPQAPLISFALLLSTNDLIVRRFIATTNLSDFLKTSMSGLFINFPDPTTNGMLTVILRISQVPIKKLPHMRRVFDSDRLNRDSR